MQHANKVKDEFLGVVSHELKTPLNVISGYSSMLTEGMLGEITPIQEKALQTVSRQSKELHNLINSVLQVNSISGDASGRISAGQLLGISRSCEPSTIIPYKDVRLVWELRTDLPILSADRGKLRHILENLINNAIKFTDQGTVTISARFLAGKKAMEFKVTDTGIGIPKELVPALLKGSAGGWLGYQGLRRWDWDLHCKKYANLLRHDSRGEQTGSGLNFRAADSLPFAKFSYPGAIVISGGK